MKNISIGKLQSFPPHPPTSFTVLRIEKITFYIKSGVFSLVEKSRI